ncbi:hypothetical protein CAEBREN_22941 [Caenorhabditis brenneri]|uniref:Uncharacterized protein n=1 Tax=Caenorhabditis brenneri TaxID=135651 RepID=G0PAP6_CAEBE|nr:hypothetical protein CAEBREN_22941 [Caenorhabditis brenneri]
MSVKLFCILAISVRFSMEFSDWRIPANTIMCSILQNTKCEFKQNWTNAEGVRRHLDAGKPEVQFFYFCNENRTENCDQWVDENNVPIESSSKEDNLVNETFTIEKMSIQILGDYVKIPQEKGDKKLIIE